MTVRQIILPAAILCLFLCGCQAETPAPTPEALPAQTAAPTASEPPALLVFAGETGVTVAGIREALAAAPSVTTVDLTDCDLSIPDAAAELLTLTDVKLRFETEICGTPVTDADTALTLTEPPEDIRQLCDVLRLLPALETVDIRGLDAADISAIAAACPDASLMFSLDLCGQPVGPDTTELNYNDIPLDSLEPFYQTLPLLPNLTKLEMCGCGVPNEDMDALRTAFPDAGIVWSIETKHWTVRTDITYFATWRIAARDEEGRITQAYSVHGCVDADMFFLYYCHDLVALDVGHNRLTSCAFVEGMPRLRYLILSDNAISDLSPLAACRELCYLEMFITKVKDFSPLSGLTELRNLNICCCRAADLSVLYALPLERLWLTPSYVENAAQAIAAFREQKPNCLVVTPTDSTGDGWRTNEAYRDMRRALGRAVD